MKLGLIAGNRALPLLFAQKAKEKNKELEIVALCFKGETNPALGKFVDRAYWVEVGRVQKALDILKAEGIAQCVMAGQISPWRIFNRSRWDKVLCDLADATDYRPHSIFSAIISFLEKHGLQFQDSTLYLSECLAEKGLMNSVVISDEAHKDIEFGVDIISRFVELDLGQTIVVKHKAVIALEALEGTDNTIKRGARIAGKDCTILKFSKKDQDLRFDVPVVGAKTLALLRRIKAGVLVLETGRVLLLDKADFLKKAAAWGIAVVGKSRKNSV